MEHVRGFSQSTTHDYRPDIDGLRAIAVSAVVLFHCGCLSAGFVGVDVFFVISGYLIGGIIWRAVSAGSFSFVEFYGRRAKRIMPALICVVIFALVFGWVVLDAAEYRTLGKTALSSIFAVSNLTFANMQDYFRPDARDHPLLMTWSLGIEEQFYLAFPLILLAAHRFLPRLAIQALLCFSLSSLMFAIWARASHPIDAFYLLPSRAWELGIGSIIAIQEEKRKMAFGGRGLETLSVAFLAALIGVCVLGSASPFVATLLATLCAAGLIVTRQSWVNRYVLSTRPLVFIGLVSYSWYLWHWPLLSFAHISAVREPPVSTMAILAIVALGIAYLSWKYIEQPFRKAQMPPLRALCLSGPTLVALGALAFYIGIDGKPDRLPAEAVQLQTTSRLARNNKCLAGFKYANPFLQCQPDNSGREIVALIGDSHAAALNFGFSSETKQRGTVLWTFAKASCAPLLGVDIPKQNMPEFAASCRMFMEQSFNALLENASIKTVVLAARWDGYVPRANIVEALRRSTEKLVVAGKRVFVVGDAPLLAFNPIHLRLAQMLPVRAVFARALWNDGPFPSVTTDQIQKVASERDLQAAAVAAGAQWLSARDALCSSAPECTFAEIGGQLLYADFQHLSVEGSTLVSRYLFAGL